MPRNKWRAFARAMLRAFYAALPLHHCPAFVPILRQLRENSTEIHLAITQRSESSRAIHPRLKTSVHSLSRGGIKFRIFHVEHFYSRVIQIDVLQVIQLLQHEVAWVIKKIAARMPLEPIQKHFEGRTIVNVFAGMNFETCIYIVLVEHIENRFHAPRTL